MGSEMCIRDRLRRFNLGDFQRPKVFTTRANNENLSDDFLDLDQLKRANLSEVLGRLKN